jgi:hypothetical protein
VTKEELELQKTEAEARKAIVEADKATIAAQLPAASEVKPKEGGVDVGGKVGVVGRLVAYHSLGKAAQEILNSVRTKAQAGHGGAARILIVEKRLLATSDWSYRIVNSQLKQEVEVLATARDGLPAERKAAEIVAPAEVVGPAGIVGPAEVVGPAAIAPGVAIAAVPGLISAAAGVAGMFKTDYAITSEDVTIGADPLVATVAETLRKARFEVAIDGFELVGGGVVQRFWDARRDRVALGEAVARLKSAQVAPSDAALETLKEERKATAAALDKALADGANDGVVDGLQGRMDELRMTAAGEAGATAGLRAALGNAEAAITRFDAFSTAVTTPAKEGDPPPLVAAALRERLHEDQTEERPRYTHVLSVSIEGSGSEVITRKTTFGKSKRIHYLGGAQVSHFLLDVAANRTVAFGSAPVLGQMRFDVKDGKAGTVQPIALRAD